MNVTAICNAALAEIGAGRISNYETDQSGVAVRCRDLYPITRDGLLGDHPWTFATMRQQLAALSVDEDLMFDLTYAFQLPTSPYCLRVLSSNQDGYYPWRVEGRKLVTDAATITIRYTARVEDTGLFDPNFTEALIAKLALKLLPTVRGDNAQKQKILENRYIYLIEEAMASNSIETTETTGDQGSTALTEVRR